MHTLVTLTQVALFMSLLILLQLLKGVFIAGWARFFGVKSDALGYTLAVLQVGLMTVVAYDPYIGSRLWHIIGTLVLAFSLTAEVLCTMQWRTESNPTGLSVLVTDPPPDLVVGRTSRLSYDNKARNALIGMYILSIVAIIFAGA